MTPVYLIHEHSLDNNDFNGKYDYEYEIDILKSWIDCNTTVYTIKDFPVKWQGVSEIYDLSLAHLINYEE